MLYHLFYPLASNLKILNIFKYLTFRTIYAMITALVVCFVLGPWIIRKLEGLQARQVIRTDGPESHLQKQGTPTMGGVMILAAIILPTLLWADLSNSYIWTTLFIIVGYGLIGFVDDYKRRTPKGSRPARRCSGKCCWPGAWRCSSTSLPILTRCCTCRSSRTSTPTWGCCSSPLWRS
jgi:phospho-N-acetylmuramoyl-pentapeptide-transferase